MVTKEKKKKLFHSLIFNFFLSLGGKEQLMEKEDAVWIGGCHRGGNNERLSSIKKKCESPLAEFLFNEKIDFNFYLRKFSLPD